jgi:hypothetical protein
MVQIFRVLLYMHLHAREIRLFVYQTIKWHLLKQVDLPRSPRRILSLILLINSLSWLELLLKHVYCWYFFLILLLRTSICVFLIAIFSQISYILPWHLLGHAIMSVVCFDLQFSRSTRPMTSFCIFIAYINTEGILFNVKITRWD